MANIMETAWCPKCGQGHVFMFNDPRVCDICGIPIPPKNEGRDYAAEGATLASMEAEGREREQAEQDGAMERGASYGPEGGDY
jgi:hypothetical protein